MDELEISGKRYISAKRAGKENKYHPDYIGQLIRGGKVEGQKVGRSWYVVADSLSTYLAKEPKPAKQEIAKDFAPKVAEGIEALSAQDTEAATSMDAADRKVELAELSETISIVKVEEKISEPIEIKTEVQKNPKEESTHEYHIPVKIGSQSGLRYLPDDEPLFPAIKKTKEDRTSYVRVMPRKAEEIEEQIYKEEREEVIVRPHTRPKHRVAGPLRRAASVLVLGGVVFAAIALLSVHLISLTKVEGEQPASVGYALNY